MRLKKANPGTRVYALALFVVLSTVALTAAPALAIPEGRSYELVSPPYKGGYSAKEIRSVAPDGESLAFFSLGAFEGDPADPVGNIYLSRRGAAGWSASPLTLPAALGSTNQIVNPVDFSSTLESSLSYVNLAPNAFGGDLEAKEAQFLVHPSAAPDTASGFSVAGETLTRDDGAALGSNVEYSGASADFSHIVFEGKFGSLVPEVEKVPGLAMYDLATRGVGEQSLHLVGVDNKGKPLGINPGCEESARVRLGNGPEGGGAETLSLVRSDLHAVSDDGSEIFFEATQGCVAAVHEQLFVRLGDAKTLEVSKPLSEACNEVPCPGSALRESAAFVAASTDGTKVFFITRAPLVPEDQDGGGVDLYMATIGCPSGMGQACEPAEREVTSLTQVSRPSSPTEAADFQSYVAISPDASHLYFVAQGVLGSGANARGETPVRGADNLYMYDSTSGGRLTFIADLCSGPGRSGSAQSLKCPLSLGEGAHSVDRNDAYLWAGGAPQAQTAGDGRFLLFASYGQLAPGDTDESADIYRYDAQDGTLARVSVGEDGFDANGNNSAFSASIHASEEADGFVSEQHDLRSRAISEDGSRVVFTTAEPLSLNATNHRTDVYEWHQQAGAGEGRVSLVSSGSSDENDQDALISPSGRDIFFLTSQGLVPQDTDGAQDVYDARLGGGFPQTPAERQPCSGDACQGPLTNPAPLLVPGSLTQSPGEELPGTAGLPAPRPVTAPKSAPAKKATGGCQKRNKHSRRHCLKRRPRPPAGKRAQAPNHLSSPRRQSR